MRPITTAAEALVEARGRLYETPQPDDAERDYHAAIDVLSLAVLGEPDPADDPAEAD